VDFRLLHEVYTSTHAEFEDEFKLIISGYLEAGGSEQVIDRMREIERRARYV
jgi:Mn2+-dependent serine/threonine protein kinase